MASRAGKSPAGSAPSKVESVPDTGSRSTTEAVRPPAATLRAMAATSVEAPLPAVPANATTRPAYMRSGKSSSAVTLASRTAAADIGLTR